MIEPKVNEWKEAKRVLHLHKCILTTNDCYRFGCTIAPKGDMIHSTNMVVRETKTTTLREYVGSMIASIVGVSSSLPIG